MIYTIENEAYGIKIHYRRADGYPARRNAILLMKAIEDAGEKAEILRDWTVSLVAAPERTGAYSIAVDGKNVTATVGGILGYQAVKAYFEELLETGSAPESVSSCVCEAFDDSNRHAFAKKGDHRVMYYNVLWDNDLLRGAGERNVMTAHIVREFSPAVVGLQECGKRKRAECYMFDIQKMMETVGYIETPVEVKNEYHDVNCTPLYYDPLQVEYLDGAYLWYSLQCHRENVHPMDRSSKSLTWGLFEDKKTKERYIVVSTHMCTQDDDIREVQAKEACELFAALKEKYNVPIMLGGDFNSLPTGKGFRYFYETAGYPSAREVATLDTCDTKTYHPYPAMDWDLELVMPTAGAELHAPEKCIDHILYPYLPNGFDTRVFGVVINDFTLAASDHFPIFVDFSMK